MTFFSQLQQQRSASPFPRVSQANGKTRVQSKERVAPLHRGQAAQPKRTFAAHTGKATFSLPKSDGTDEDDWVSSESGAATPHDPEDDDQRTRTPVEDDHKTTIINDHVNGATPRAETPLPRVDTIRPNEPLRQVQQMHPPVVNVHTATPIVPPTADTYRQTRSEAPSPTQLRDGNTSKRSSMIRQSSGQSAVKVEVPHHPLIRGQSYHGGLKPAALAPLTVKSESAQAQLSASPTSSYGILHSPNSIDGSILNESPDRDEPHIRPTRKASFSSIHSVATLPAPSSRQVVGSRSRMNRAVDRTRTLSVMSTSSSSAALTSLNTLPGGSRPGTPPLTVHFTPETHSRREHAEGLHQLLPPPYMASHMSTLSQYNPMADCYARVMRAKHTR